MQADLLAVQGRSRVAVSYALLREFAVVAVATTESTALSSEMQRIQDEAVGYVELALSANVATTPALERHLAGREPTKRHRVHAGLTLLRERLLPDDAAFSLSVLVLRAADTGVFLTGLGHGVPMMRIGGGAPESLGQSTLSTVWERTLEVSLGDVVALGVVGSAEGALLADEDLAIGMARYAQTPFGQRMGLVLCRVR